MASRNAQGVWVTRATLALMGGDFACAVVYDQACWIQAHFDGPWRAPADWWARLLSMSKKAARAALRRLEKLGLLEITTRGLDRAWHLLVKVEEGEARVDAARRSLPDALLWEISGKRAGAQAADQAPAPAPAPAPAKPAPRPQARKLWEIPVADPVGSCALAPLLRETYPHPTNNGARALVPSEQQVELWLLEMIRRSKVMLTAETVEAITAAASSAKSRASREPGSFRRTLKNWLLGLDWQQEEAAPQARTRPQEERALSSVDYWAEEESRYEKARAAGTRLVPLPPPAKRTAQARREREGRAYWAEIAARENAGGAE